MSSIQIEIPWLLAITLGVLVLCGTIAVIIKTRDAVRMMILLWKGGRIPTEAEQEAKTNRLLSQADRDAQAILDQRIRNAWTSFSSVPWTDPKALFDDCQSLITEIASAYYPESKNPALEVTVTELLKMNERISREIATLIAAFPSIERLSAASILDAKALLNRTKDIVEKKSIRKGGRFAGRLWKGLNALNPNYWINKTLLKGASEAVGRKIVTSIYRIAGAEAIRIYRHSSATHIDTSQPVYNPELSEPAIVEKDKQEPESSPDIEAQETIIVEVPETEPPGDDSMQDEFHGTPTGQYGSIAETLSKFIEGSMQAWDKMVNPEKVFASFRKQGAEVHSLADVRALSIEQVDTASDAYVTKGQWLSAAEGAATGFGGALLLTADAVSLLALQLRTLQQIGYCYGFDVSKPEEKLFAAKLLAEAYQHPARSDRAGMLKEMRMAAGLLKGKTPFGLLKKRLFVQGFSKIAQKIGIRMGSRKAAQLLPVIGSVAGGIINKKVTKDIALIARDVYRDRFLEAKNNSPASSDDT